MWVLINEHGETEAIRVRTSSGMPELDDAGAKVARVMRFNPARNQGNPVKVWVQLPIVFKSNPR